MVDIYYKLVNIPKLTLIQNQILQEMSKNYNSIKTGFYAVKSDVLKSKWTLLCEYLTSVNLLDRWTGVGISVLNNSNINVHTDSKNSDRIYALNIPILDCKNTYTIWYKQKIGAKQNISSYNSFGNTVDYVEYNLSDVEEICRLESSNSAFVNVKIPHRGITTHNNFRCLISLRFNPDLTKSEIEAFK
jgi:hypothetical protein